LFQKVGVHLSPTNSNYSLTAICSTVRLQEIVNWARSLHRRHDATRLRCRQICSDLSRPSPTNCEFHDTRRRRDSTRQLRLVGGGGVYWALAYNSDCRGARHFCPKNMYEKLTKYPNFYNIFSQNINKIPEFYMILPVRCPNLT